MNAQEKHEMLRGEYEAQKAALESIYTHPGGKLFLELLKTQLIAARAVELRTNLDSMDAAFVVARQKGFVQGLEQSLATIEQHLTALQSNLERLYEEIQNDAE